jgi:hypothetical protein
MSEAEILSRKGTPWTLRICDALPVSPALAGALFALILVAALLGSELAMGRLSASPSELRLAVVHCLLVAYLPTAYAYVILWSRRTVSELRPALDCSEGDFVELADRVGSYRRWGLVAVGIVTVAAMVRITAETTPFPESPWSWSLMTPEVRWHRVLAPIAAWWFGCFVYAVIAESHRLSLLARRLASIDLLDLRPLMPFTRQALSNALLVLAGVSIFSLFLVEERFLIVVTRMWIAAAIVATASFLLPILGVRRMIRSAKRAELDWCRDALRRARAALRQGATDPQRLPMDEVVAYKQVVEGVREWPFDSSTVVRFAIYLLIPLASWSGGAVVERMIDSLLE